MPEVPYVEFSDFVRFYDGCLITYSLTGDAVFDTALPIAKVGVINRVSFFITEINTVGTFSFTLTG